MPIYEYACQHCGHHLETIQKITDKPLQRCEQCGQDRLEKQISATSFRLKGSGWYVTDYNSGSNNQKTENTASKSDTSGE